MTSVTMTAVENEHGELVLIPPVPMTTRAWGTMWTLSPFIHLSIMTQETPVHMVLKINPDIQLSSINI